MSYDLKSAEHAAYAPFFGYMGAASAQIFTVLGAAYGTAKSAVGISSMGVMRPELIMKSVIPVIMAGEFSFLLSYLSWVFFSWYLSGICFQGYLLTPLGLYLLSTL